MIDWFQNIEWLQMLIIALAFIVLIVGIIGCILPVVPGPPISFVAMLILHYSKYYDFETLQLVSMGLLALVVQILDYIVPAWGTKKFGGTKYGTWGSIIGLIVGLFFVPAIGPFGIITILAGPFVGAFVGEVIGGREKDPALKAAFGSFVGFLTGTLMKLITSIVITVVCISEIFFK